MVRRSRTNEKRRARHLRRLLVAGILTIVCGAVLPPLAAYFHVSSQGGIDAALAQTAEQSKQPANPHANFWRAVREGVRGTTTVSGPEAGVLIQNGGQNWRALRNGPIANYGGWLMFAGLIILALHLTFRGPSRIEGGRSGRTVPRWHLANRFLHWYTAILFIVLAITGLSLLFGRAVLIPVLGLGGFAAWAAFCKDLHNLLGPAFAVGVVLMIVCWFAMHLPEKVDWEWLRQGGGLLRKGQHVSAGRVNAGEKILFFLGVVVLGLAVVVSGVLLDFPNLGWSRATMQIADVVHAVAALIWITLIFGHIYLGTIGNEGALEGMTRGRVDVNWARQHHDLWYEQVKDAAEEEAPRGGVPREQPT